MRTMLKFDRRRLIFGLYLLVLVGIAEIVTHRYRLPAWPAFLAMIFFFVEHVNPRHAPQILIGAVAGIGSVLLFPPFIGWVAPLLGVEAAKILLILVLVYAIVAFGEMLPLVFNNYAFVFLTVSGLALKAPAPDPFLWMAVAAGGGALLIGGIILIGKIMGPTATAATN
jgi:hypothetical protein